MCWIAIEYNLFIQSIEIIRNIFGPLSPTFCFMKTVYRNSLTKQAMLFMDAIAIIRYLFIFWLKNPAAFRNEFWNDFIRRWIIAASFFSNLVVFFLADHFSIDFYICSGLDPTEDFKKPNDTLPLILLATVLIYIFVFVR
jgi:hypothetical protein